MAECQTCHGRREWWEWRSAGGDLSRAYGCANMEKIPPAAVHYVCTDCLGGAIHCCDGERASLEAAQ